MKIYDIVNEDVATEAPMGLASRLGNKVMSKLGSKSAGARLDVGNDANTMKKDLATWMSGSGIAKGQLTPDDFKNFLGQKGLPTTNVDAMLGQSRSASGRDENEMLSNPEVDELLKKAVQSGFRDQGAKGRQSKFAAKNPPMPSMGGGRVDPATQQMIDKLKAAGYNVTK
tara:strand:+ start:129 stop:638 length:510 start_codon:yes stop_codon:yes gene_type:complete